MIILNTKLIPKFKYLQFIQVIEMEEDRLRSAHSIDLAYKQFLNNNVQGGLMGEAWYNQVSQFICTFEKTNGITLDINETTLHILATTETSN